MRLTRQTVGMWGALLGVLSLVASTAHAGNPLSFQANGAPYKWSTLTPVPYSVDGGSMGLWNSATSVANVVQAFNRWGPDLPTSALTFANAGSIPGDGDIDTIDEYIAYVTAPCDGISPVIVDADGSLFEALGVGSNIIGFAGPMCYEGDAITGAMVVMNGKWIDGNPNNGEITEEAFKVALIHEAGHFLNLHHSQVSGFFGDSDPGKMIFGEPPVESVAVMFPFIYNDATAVLKKDDAAAISRMYPAPGFSATTGTITGTIRYPNGSTPFLGANVIARNVADPFFDAVSNVSGVPYDTPSSVGAYELPGLTAGAMYAVEMVNAGSGLPVQSVIPAPEEFFNGENESASDPPDNVLVYVAVPSVAGQQTGGIDIVMNGGEADVSLTMTASPDPVANGQDVTYTLAVTNAGPSTATGTTVTDTLPPGVAFVWAAPSQGDCQEMSGTVTCNLGDMNSGAVATATIVVATAVSGPITNTASVSTYNSDPDTANNSASVTTTVISAADLAVTQADSPDPAPAGDPVTYTMTVRNNGPDTATGVILTDALPTQATFVSVTSSQGACGTPSGQTVTCSLGAFGSGATATVVLVVTPDAAEDVIVNSASVSAIEGDPNGGNNSTTELTYMSTVASVTLTDITLFPAAPTLQVGQSQPMTPVGTFSNGTQATLTSPAGAVVGVGVLQGCALQGDGTVRCWGLNSEGQLGDGTLTNSSTPVTVSGISTATAVATGGYHSCAVLVDGTVRCWGSNFHGQLGNGTSSGSSIPVTVSGITTATTVSAGTHHTCAVLSDATLRCWGSNVHAQLGDGTFNTSSLPVTVSGVTTAAAVAAGNLHTCAALLDGRVRCWGDNEFGQLGDGTTTDAPTPVAVIGITTATAAAGGFYHTCAVLLDGTVRCWGWNVAGQLGDGTTTDSPMPVAVSGINTGTAVAGGVYHTCAVLADGSVRCWGSNASGQLGTGTTESYTPAPVSGINTATGVSAAWTNTCATLVDGSVRCWGDNTFGQLGNGKATQATTPVTVTGITTATAVAGGFYHSCAVQGNGTVRCWGNNAFGQLGNGTFTSSGVPVAVSGITTATAVATGFYHTCALLTDGSVRCWGYNGFGVLGDGTGTNSPTPVPVSGITTATTVAAGDTHACAGLSDGTVRCWGNNGNGQLGNGTFASASTPEAVSGVGTATAVAAGDYHTCAVLADGSVRCWGWNVSGQLGDGTTTDALTPVVASGISTATAVDGGRSHTCAVLADGTVRCWGNNGSGELGDGTTTNSNTPVPVTGINTAVAVAPGGSHTCALLTDGTLRCWGQNGGGQLGNGTTTQSLEPVVVSGLSTATTVASGFYHTCAVLADGIVRCWGMGASGELGDGSAGLVPQTVLDVLAARPLVWSSSDPGVATVDANGLVTGVSPGGTLVNATSGGVTGSTTVTVVPVGHVLIIDAVGGGGNGSGIVAPDPQGTELNCFPVITGSCYHYSEGAVVTLLPTPATGSVFVGWSGSPDCLDGVVTMTMDITCSATFNTEGTSGTRAINISARAFVQTGDNVLIGGFIIAGNAPKTVLVRVRGPSLVEFGVAGAIANPYVELYSGQTKIAQNDNWQTPDPLCGAPAISCEDAAAIAATNLDPCDIATTGCTLDSAILITLPPGPYTAIVRGVGGRTGVANVGVFDLDPSTAPKMINISARSLVLSGDNVMIGGFIVGGGVGNKTVLVRVRGPSLAEFGVSGPIANPYVELYSGSTKIAQNDNWQTTDPLCGAPAISCGRAAEIAGTTLDPCDIATTGCTLDSAILITLPPGPYTAIVRGVGGVTGVANVGVFDLSP